MKDTRGVRVRAAIFASVCALLLFMVSLLPHPPSPPLPQSNPAKILPVIAPMIASENTEMTQHNMNAPLLTTVKVRDDIANFLETDGMRTGVELGVREGEFAHTILSRWFSCTKYVLVDLWKHQENYADDANKDDSAQENTMQRALETLENFKDKIEICRNYTTSCATQYPDDFFDFIYVDARHDFKGVAEDLSAWWPKLKAGGVFGGHDYVTNDDGPLQSGQNWALNYDGSVDPLGRAVKGAVDDFAISVNRQIVVTYRESGWNSWFLRK